MVNPIALKKYINDKKSVSLAELASNFQTTPSTIKSILELWIKKNEISNSPKCSYRCKNCMACKPYEITTYRMDILTK